MHCYVNSLNQERFIHLAIDLLFLSGFTTIYSRIKHISVSGETDLTSEFEDYILTRNDGESFEHLAHNGFMKAKKRILFTSAKVTDFMIPNLNTKEAFQFSQHLYQLTKRGIKIKFIP